MNCERCGVVFDEKKFLIQHLKKKIECMPIFSEKSRLEIIADLNKKNGIPCIKCKKIYSNKYNLAKHKCKASLIPVLENSKMEELQEQIKEMQKTLKILLDKPLNNIIIDNSTTTNIENQNNTNNNTQNINITINSLDKDHSKQIKHIMENSALKDLILEWIVSKDGLLKYIDYKFFNPEHPENHMIKPGDTKEHIDLHIYGKWKKFENLMASDLILNNVGLDFESYFGILKYENEDDYKKNKKAILKFKDNIVDPLDWYVGS
jgi:uncharacterized C2H2 Zn-finger protein